MYTLSDLAAHSARQENSSAIYASSSEQHPSRTTPDLTARTRQPTARGKQPTVSIEDHQFLSLLFDRQDFLAASEDEDDTALDGTLDPRLLFEDGTSSSRYGSISRLPSPEKLEQSIYATHLRSRQPIVNAIRIHPNLNLRNLFGNLPFSSSVRANNYPVDVQETQVNNLFLPTWAMMTVSTRPDPGSVKFAFQAVMHEANALLESGTPVESVIEVHPNVAALFVESEFHTSGILSRWAAGMVHSMLLKGM